MFKLRNANLKKKIKVQLEGNLLVMGWRNPLEKDPSLGDVDVGVHPSGPSGETLPECHQTVHVIVIDICVLNVGPSAPKLIHFPCI